MELEEVGTIWKVRGWIGTAAAGSNDYFTEQKYNMFYLATLYYYFNIAADFGDVV